MTTIIKKYVFADGIGTAYDIDNGDAVIDFVSNSGKRIAQISVCYEHGKNKSWKEIDDDLAGNEHRTIIETLSDPLEWENGMGASAFDANYFTDF